MTETPPPPQPVTALGGALPAPVEGDRSWAAIVSLITGIVSVPAAIGAFFASMCCCLCNVAGIPFALAGIIFGIIGFKSEKGMLAKIGIALSALSLLILLAYWIFMLIYVGITAATSGHH